jgi:hypothetical protein
MLCEESCARSVACFIIPPRSDITITNIRSAPSIRKLSEASHPRRCVAIARKAHVNRLRALLGKNTHASIAAITSTIVAIIASWDSGTARCRNADRQIAKITGAACVDAPNRGIAGIEGAQVAVIARNRSVD